MTRIPTSRRARRFVLGLCAAAFVSAGAPARDRTPPRLVFTSERDTEPPRTAVNGLEAPTDVGNLRIILSNAGTFGTAFQARETPSMEWPARSGLDHLVRASVWVGAISSTSGDTLVTIGGRDAQYTDGPTLFSEWTPASGRPQETSRLRTSPFFQDGAIADEVFHTAYVDSLAVPEDPTDQGHRPAGLRVTQKTYSWGFDPLDDFLIVELNITNTGFIGTDGVPRNAPLDKLWVGIYSELVTNDRQANWPAWPPGGRWFDFQDPSWDAENHMIVNRNVERRLVSPELRAAIKVVGTGGRGPYGRGADSLSTKQISLAAWNWAPNDFMRWDDAYLYQLMASGQITNVDSTIFEPSIEANPVTVLSVGPFAELAPDSTLQVVFAFLAGEDQADLDKNAFWVQKAYNDAYALPSPPSPPKLRVYPRHNELVLRWSADPEHDRDPATQAEDFQGYRIYVSQSPLAAQYQLVRQVDIRDGNGFDTGLDVVRLPNPIMDGNAIYSYEAVLQGIPDGFKRYVAVTSYDFQQGDPPSLESGVLINPKYTVAGPDADQARGKPVSVFPNPYRGESSFDGRDSQGSLNPRKRILWFVNLPPRARVRIYTLAGDLVRSYEYDAATYRGTEAAGISPDNADLQENRYLVTGGTMAAFDLLSENRQEIASGLYLFSVEDLNTGEMQQGKFLVLK